jgi:hypothetical protein
MSMALIVAITIMTTTMSMALIVAITISTRAKARHTIRMRTMTTATTMVSRPGAMWCW